MSDDIDDDTTTPLTADAIILKNLSDGFRAIRQRRDTGPSDATIRLSSTQPFLAAAPVNFIDPTSPPGGVVSTSSAKPPLELYNKLQTILQDEYQCTLRQVSYQHFRSGAAGVIDSLIVQPFLTSSHGGLMTEDQHVLVPGAAETDLGNDPSAWHATPYCHVYLAACESLEDYRHKVKPSIQAFLSQIEASAKASSTPRDTALSSLNSSTASLSGTSYVVVFCPTGERAAEETPRPTRMGAAFASRMAAAARQRMAATSEATLSSSANNSTHDTVASTEGDEAETLTLPTAGQQSILAQLSKVDREVFRRMAADFSNGNVCVLSTLLSDTDQDELRRLEWSAFLKSLASGIADGFRDRCRRYDEVLRQIDHVRALPPDQATKIKADLIRQRKKFDLGYFFLVKESLAFTCEQMCLPSEALLLYEELRAVLPDMQAAAVPDDESVDPDGALTQVALAGNSIGFRKHLGSVHDVKSIAQAMQLYLFTRQTSLLFKMNKSVEVVERCIAVITALYDYKCRALPMDCAKQDRMGVERWAFDFCWAVKRSCDLYLADDVSESMEGDDDGGGKRRRKSRKMDELLARCICNVLEFARLRMMRMGDVLLEENPVRTQQKTMAAELITPWKPWKPGVLAASDEEDDEESVSRNGVEALVDGDILEDALSSEESFLSRYVDLLRILEAFNRFSGRRRCAARVAVEMSGLYILKKAYERAANALRAVADVYREDNWSMCHFVLLFRLAGYQRMVSNADDYAETLVQCFSPHHVKIAPCKALGFLQSDLEAVLSSTLVSYPRVAAKPLFDPALGLEDITPKKSSDRQLMKKVYSVGERVLVTMGLTSYLPREITAEAITVDLVPFREYVGAMEDSTYVHDDDVFRKLRLEGPVAIRPGENDLSFSWVPMTSGQFVLALISIKWKGIRFTYTSKDLKRPTIRVDVIPSEPKHSLQVSPAYLLPGHQQPVKLSFFSGTDIIDDAQLKLVCSPGLLLLPPGEDETSTKWMSSCETEFPDCAPGESVNVSVVVKSSGAETASSEHGSHAIHATVATSYCVPYAVSEDGTVDDLEEPSYMTHTLEVKVPTLERQALTVGSVELVSYGLDRSMLNVLLQCNTPGPLKIKGWALVLPDFLVLADDGDVNGCLAVSTVHMGERLSMAFDCVAVDPGIETSPSPELLVDIVDEFGSSFREKLDLGLKRPTVARAVLPDIRPLSVEVVPSCAQGLVGFPITLSYKIDTAELASLPGSTSYQLDANMTSWVVSGKAKGVVVTSDAPFQATFVAIPVRPGVLDQYPVLSLLYQAPDQPTAVTLPLADNMAGPALFEALSPSIHTAVAVPVAKVKRDSSTAKA